jgi:hypothetical protein
LPDNHGFLPLYLKLLQSAHDFLPLTAEKILVKNLFAVFYTRFFYFYTRFSASYIQKTFSYIEKNRILHANYRAAL